MAEPVSPARVSEQDARGSGLLINGLAGVLSRRRARGQDALSVEGIAGLVQRLAVMLAAGVAPANAWGYLAELAPRRRDAGSRGGAVSGGAASGGADSPEEVSRAVAAAVLRGEAIPTAIAAAAQACSPRAAEAWRAVAASWLVATTSGAPLAGCLREMAEALRQLGQLHRDVDAALAGPVSTARFVAVLPIVGLLFGTILGFDTLGILFATPLGLACLTVGVTLSLIAGRWSAMLVRRARPASGSPGLTAQLVAIALTGGGSITGARESTAAACERFSVGETGGEAGVETVLALSRRAGVPAAELLRSEAQQDRRAARTQAQLQAAALGTSLMIPLGLCVLPAFMVLGVAPLMLAVLSSTVTGI
jgi:tight adherence protein B